jgi:hypothetical protein
VAVPFAVPLIGLGAPEALTATATTRAVSVGVDYVSQVVANGVTGKGFNSFFDVNLTSLAMSGLNPGGKFATLLLNNTIASSFSFSPISGANTVLGKKSILRAGFETAVGTAAGWAGGQLTYKLSLRLENVGKATNYFKELGAKESSWMIRDLNLESLSIFHKINTTNTITGAAGNTLNNATDPSNNSAPNSSNSSKP